MAGESLGTARIDIIADASSFKATIDSARGLLASLGPEATRALSGVAGPVKAATTSFLKWTETIGKTGDELVFLKAAMRGVPVEVLDAGRTKVLAFRAATEQAAVAAEHLATATAKAAREASFVSEVRLGTGANDTAAAAVASELKLANAARAASDALSEQQQRVAVLAARFHELEAAEAKAASQKAGQDNFVASLQAQAQAIGKTRAELLELKAAELGVANAAAPFIAKLKEQEAGLAHAGAAFNAYGRSAKQNAQALRQVPAQITDIFVGLQGGQNPLTVLIQQGGQLKDVFGGIRPAAEALGGALFKLINPYTLLAAAVVGVAVAITTLQADQGRLANSLILTGNAAGTSTDQLRAFSEQIDNATTASERSAERTVASVAATGVFTSKQIGTVSLAAQQMQEATGRAIATTVAEFASLKEGPVDAILKLNATIGDGTNVTHFLTAETLKQIQALRDQGKEAQATEVAINAYANAIGQRAPQITDNLTSIGKAWSIIKDQAGAAVLGMLKGIRAVDQASAQTIKSFSDRLRAQGGLIAAIGIGVDKAFADPLDDPSKRKARPPARGGSPVVDPQQAAAAKQFQEQGLRFLSDEQKLTRDIAEARRIATAAGITDNKVIEARIAAIRREAAEHKKKGRTGDGGIERADNRAALQAFKDTLTEEQSAISSSTQILQAQYSARIISAKDYYAQQRELTQRGLSAEEASLQGQIKVLQDRNVKGRDSIDTLRQIGELEAQLSKVRSDSATKTAVLAIQEQALEDARLDSIRAFKNQLDETNIAAQAQQDALVSHIGLGRQEAAQQDQLNSIYAQQARVLRDLAEQLRTNAITQATHDADVAIQQAATDKMVSIVTEGYDRMKAAQADWLNGFHSALTDFIDGTNDVAGQVADITTRSLDKASEALATFVSTGKLDFKSLLDSIVADITKALSRKLIGQFFGSLFGEGASSSDVPSPGDFFQNANGNAFGASGLIPFANGGAFGPNSILSRPTAFRFGNRLGVAGEAGEEAIMPLSRRNGKLGVRVDGGATAAMHDNRVYNINVAVQGDLTKRTGQQAANDIRREMAIAGRSG